MNSSPVGGGVSSEYGSILTMDHTIVAWSTTGCGVNCDGGSSVTLGCCDLFENDGGDWVGSISGQYGVNGNIAVDPFFCNDAHVPGGLDPLEDAYGLSLHADSPCAAENNPECGQIGAWPVGCVATTDVSDGAGVAGGLTIASRPNPFSSTTRISCVIPGGAGARPVDIGVYDAAGRLVRALAGDWGREGSAEVTWDGTTDTGNPLAGGIYFVRVRAGNNSRSERIVLVR